MDIPAELFSPAMMYGQRPNPGMGKVVLSTGTEISVMPTDLSMNSRSVENSANPLPDISIRACAVSPNQSSPEESIAANIIKKTENVSNLAPSETFNTFLQRYITDRCTSNDMPSPPTQNQNQTNNLIDCYFSRQVKHVHCLVPECPAQRFQQIIPKTFEDIIKHFKYHFDIEDSELETSGNEVNNFRNHKIEEHRTNVEMGNLNHDGADQNSCSIGEFFNRKRGRPPKNRFFEVYNTVSKKLLFYINLIFFAMIKSVQI